ncbi:cytochrome c oxidase subunit II [Litorisediminicola beolgyonensis]|uniref:Cytochrome c oxidase subunit 2 n=1 Tax=Litorisediminicola beolgyonensis TaxID=1173614 RepID=A0ABW3ZMA3_9RHOB
MRLKTMLMALSAAFFAAPAFAQDALEVIGQPKDGAFGFQPAATSLAEDIHWLDGMVTIIITVITLFVMALLAICIFRYNQKSNPTPAKFTHNTPVEIAWTIVPVIILVFIGAFSLPVLFNQQEIPEGDIHIKATGYQWYWGYEYSDDEFAYDSYMIGSPATGGDNSYNEDVEAQLIEAGYEPEHFLLATDTPVVVPVGKTVVLTVTGGDVIHSWTIPAFGVKQDGVPGRLAHLWFTPEREGIYFGQCSELCGIAHAYMPITVKVVSEEEYATWIAQMKEEWG